MAGSRVAPAAQPRSKLKMSMSMAGGASKSQKRPAEESDADESDDGEDGDSQDDGVMDSDDGADSDASRDTDDEIGEQGKSRSKKTQKRRRRAVSPTAFGEALEGLLGTAAGTDATAEARRAEPSSNAILSLAPRVRKSANATTLRARAGRIALQQRRELEERGHVKDVIGEWGPPGVLPASRAPEEAPGFHEWMEQGGAKGHERRLRKVAQRGVVKLFNAIRAAQTTSPEDIDKAREQSTSHKTNPLGNREAALNELSRNNFLDLLRSGQKK